MRGRGGLEANRVAEPLQAPDQAAFEVLPVQVIEVGWTEFLIGLSASQDVVDDDEDSMPEGHESAFLAAPRRNPPVLGREVGVSGLRGDMGNLDQDLTQPMIPLPRLATEPFAPALRIARTHASP